MTTLQTELETSPPARSATSEADMTCTALEAAIKILELLTNVTKNVPSLNTITGCIQKVLDIQMARPEGEGNWAGGTIAQGVRSHEISSKEHRGFRRESDGCTDTGTGRSPLLQLGEVDPLDENDPHLAADIRVAMAASHLQVYQRPMPGYVSSASQDGCRPHHANSHAHHCHRERGGCTDTGTGRSPFLQLGEVDPQDENDPHLAADIQVPMAASHLQVYRHPMPVYVSSASQDGCRSHHANSRAHHHRGTGRSPFLQLGEVDPLDENDPHLAADIRVAMARSHLPVCHHPMPVYVPSASQDGHRSHSVNSRAHYPSESDSSSVDDSDTEGEGTDDREIPDRVQTMKDELVYVSSASQDGRRGANSRAHHHSESDSSSIDDSDTDGEWTDVQDVPDRVQVMKDELVCVSSASQDGHRSYSPKSRAHYPSESDSSSVDDSDTDSEWINVREVPDRVQTMKDELVYVSSASQDGHRSHSTNSRAHHHSESASSSVDPSDTDGEWINVRDVPGRVQAMKDEWDELMMLARDVEDCQVGGFVA
ncbi:hypothetical protein FB451DRAFT_76721 [Mycena latifolia]|nr:hypothetical protein FB451DRAFT_76721 [Mycena latifolia]